MSAENTESVVVPVVLGLAFIVYTLILTVAIAKLGLVVGLVIAFFTVPAYFALLGGLLDPKGRRK